MHSLVLHFAHNLSHVALQGRSCSSVPLTHCEEQDVQVVEPLTLAKLIPSWHAEQLVLPALEAKVPTGHRVHLLVTSEEYVPAGQTLQTVEAGWSVKLPGAHAMHWSAVPLEAENVPAGHGMHDAAPSVEKKPGPHEGHTAAARPKLA